jgi:hypothetical protein
MSYYGYAPEGRIDVTLLSARSLPKAITEARAELWDTRVQGDRARLYRRADGWRFIGIVTYDGRFVDERVSA